MQSEPQNARALVWALSRSLAATWEIDFSFSSSGYLDVSVHRVPLHKLWIYLWIHGVFPCGFPHSDIRGSLDICSSPRLFAAYHVFLRLSVPRHPPCALSCLTISPLFAEFPLPCIALQVPGFSVHYFAFGFRHLNDDGLGCLILLSAVFSADFLGYFSIFGIRFSRYDIS